jgi:hypothetical protein
MSTLIEIRTAFVNKSGRTDLVIDTTNYQDNGANFYIQAGQRLLDTMIPSPKSVGRYIKDINAGDYKLMMSYVRSVESVWIKSSSSLREELEMKPLSWLMEEYGDSITDNSQGTPKYWSPLISVLSPEQKDLTEVTYTTQFTRDYEEIVFGSTRYQKEGITFRPVSNEAYTLTVFAHFFSLLSVDADVSWHSENYPELLIMAANLCLETFYRNSAGVQDWLQAMQLFLKGIDHDIVRTEMVAAGNQLRG